MDRRSSNPPPRRTSLGQNCRTPCEFTVQLASRALCNVWLGGYQPQTVWVRSEASTGLNPLAAHPKSGLRGAAAGSGRTAGKEGSQEEASCCDSPGEIVGRVTCTCGTAPTVGAPPCRRRKKPCLPPTTPGELRPASSRPRRSDRPPRTEARDRNGPESNSAHRHGVFQKTGPSQAPLLICINGALNFGADENASGSGVG